MFYEIRRETAVPGRGKDLARWMDDEVVPLHQSNGMTVVASFVEAGDDDAFVWIRKFDGDEERAAILDRVHADPRWSSAVAPTVFALLAAEAVTVRLLPTPGSALR
jgi:NIPSNAP protein